MKQRVNFAELVLRAPRNRPSVQECGGPPPLSGNATLTTDGPSPCPLPIGWGARGRAPDEAFAPSNNRTVSRGRRIKLAGLKVFTLAVGLLISIYALGAAAKDLTLLNVSYDPTRELYDDYNTNFAKYWQGKTGDTVKINTTHDGSGKQARKVIDGVEADVVTLALAYDVDQLHDRANLIPKDWQKRLPNNSTPYTSTIVFLVRKGNPKNIKDWDDLVRSGVIVVTPSPKTSGGARWNYLAAWGYALKKNNNDESKARDFITRLYRNVPIQDTGARGATETFARNGIGDVLIAWENEAYLQLNDLGRDKFEIVTPSISILAEPPVALVDRYAKKHGMEAVAKAYLEYLYSPEGQEIAARHYYRPRNEEVAQKHAGTFAKVNLFTIDDVFGGWQKAQATHFNEGGVYDQIQAENR